MEQKILELIKKRRSIRKYLDVSIEWDKVVSILEAGRWAPSAGNLQEWRFIVVTEPDIKKGIAESCLQQYWIESAPVVIVITSMQEKQEQYYGKKLSSMYIQQDAAAAAQNMLLMGTELDLGSCWIGGFDEPELRSTLGIPERSTPLIVLTFGYADEKVPIPPRTPLEPLTYLQGYGNRVRNINLVLWNTSLEIEKHAKNVSGKIKKVIDKVVNKAKKKKDEH